MKSSRSIFCLALFFVFYSCEKDSDMQNYQEITSTQVQTLTMSDEIVDQVELLVGNLNKSQSFYNDSVLEYNVNTSQITCTFRDSLLFPRSSRFPNTIVLNFNNGFKSTTYTMKGKLIVYIKDTLSLVSSSKKIIYNNFYVDDTKFDGNKLITFKGTLSTIDPTKLDSIYYIISSHDTISVGNAKTALNSYLTKKCIMLGGDTVKYMITGYFGGIDSENLKFTSGISAVKPLIRYSTYPFIVAGLINFTSGDHTAKFDYGEGTLDDKGLFTYENGDIKTIIIK